MVLLVVALLAACSDDADTSCEPEGFASGEADVLGAPLGPFARAAVIITPAGASGAQLAIVLDEADGTCGQPGRDGRRLVVAFCVTPTSGTYEITSGLRCGSETAATQVSALLEDADGTDRGSAIGTLTLTHAGGCVRGSYEMMIAGATLAGELDAVVCAPE